MNARGRARSSKLRTDFFASQPSLASSVRSRHRLLSAVVVDAGLILRPSVRHLFFFAMHKLTSVEAQRVIAVMEVCVHRPPTFIQYYTATLYKYSYDIVWARL